MDHLRSFYYETLLGKLSGRRQNIVSCCQIQLVRTRDGRVRILQEPRKHCFHAFVALFPERKLTNFAAETPSE